MICLYTKYDMNIHYHISGKTPFRVKAYYDDVSKVTDMRWYIIASVVTGASSTTSL